MLGPLLLTASPFFAQGGISDEPKKEHARGWYAGVQSNVPFGIGTFSSFDANGNIRTSDVTADRMLPGGRYTVCLQYEKIRSQISLLSVRDSYWEYGLTYTGNVFVPDGEQSEQ